MNELGYDLSKVIYGEYNKLSPEEQHKVKGLINGKDKEINCDSSIAFPAEIMDGVAWEFADLYSAYLETPKSFLWASFQAILGNIVADRLTIKTELKPQPRLFVLLLGESAEPRKSTSISKTLELFSDTLIREDFNLCWGVGSAEGLQKRLDEIKEPRKLMLCFDEFKTFVSKAKIESSVLLPCVNTLFESNHYHNTTKKISVKLENVFLTILAASTVATYDRIWDSSFTDIGFNNRLFLVPDKGVRRFAIPEKIPDVAKNNIKRKIRSILASIGDGLELDLTLGARRSYENWYLSLEKSIHANRLDSYALRFMPLIAVNEEKRIIDEEVVLKTVALMNWQLEVRRLHDPVDAENRIAKMEEKIRRYLKNGRWKERDLKRYLHVNSEGLYVFKMATTNLTEAGEIEYNKTDKTYLLLDEV